MKQFKQVIQEGVYDPGIFKAFFLAGGPGSGKTYVTNRATGGMGLKLVNSDTRFERYLTKAGLSLKMPDKEAALRDPLRARAREGSLLTINLAPYESESFLTSFPSKYLFLFDKSLSLNCKKRTPAEKAASRTVRRSDPCVTCLSVINKRRSIL